MRLDRDHLALLGLIALDEMVMKCREGPQVRPISLRATLAMLYVLSGRGDRGPFDAFWQACIDPAGGTNDEKMARERKMNGLLHDICRAVGFEPRPETTTMIVHARNALGHETTMTGIAVQAARAKQARMAEIFREAARGREEERERRRMGHDCKLRG